MSTASASTDWLAVAVGPVAPVTWNTTAITATNAAEDRLPGDEPRDSRGPAVVDTNINSTAGHSPFHAPNRTERVVWNASASEARPLWRLVAEPSSECLTKPRVSAITNPRDVSIGTDQHGARCINLADDGKLPGAGV